MIVDYEDQMMSEYRNGPDKEEKEEPFRFLSGKDYPHLCPKCQAQVTAFAAVFEMGITEDTDDPEAPCNEVYDRRLFCGGFECVNRPKGKKKKGD